MNIAATGSTTLTAKPAFSGDADSSAEASVAYKWEIKSGTEYAKIASGAGKATATITGTNTTESERQAIVHVTATYNGVPKSAKQTISIAAASSDNPDNPDTPVTPSEPTKITITYITERGTAPDAKTVELTDSLYTLTSDDLPELTEKGYLFGGWAVSTGSTTTGTGSTTTTTVKVGDTITENTTLYAVWTPITYTVRFDSNGGSGEAIPDITATYDVSFEIPANTFTRSGYSASSNNTWNKKEDGSGTSYIAGKKSKNLTSKNGNTVTLYAIWVESGSHSIAYLDTDGSSISGMSPLTFKETEDVDLTGVVPSKAGYTFSGWVVSTGSTTPDAGSTTPGAGSTTISGWKAGEMTSDVTLYALWTANTDTAYTVKHLLQNVSLDGYEEQTADAESKTGTTGEMTSAEAKTTYAGFTAKSFEQGTIAGDGSTVVSIYYDRNTVTLTFDTDGGSEIAPITGKYGTAVTAPEEPTKEGVTFSSWNPWFPETFPEEDTTYTATWRYPSDATPYKVRHMVRTLDGDDYELYEEETLIGKAGEKTQAVAKSIKGFRVSSSYIFQSTIYSDGSTVIEINYRREYISLTFQSMTNYGYSEKNYVYGYYGAELTPPDNPERSGYTFAGWSPEVPATFPAEDTTYTAQWDDGSRSYKVRRFRETLDGDYELCDEETLTGKAGEYTNAYSYSYEGFSEKSFDQEIIAEDESTVVSIYYDRKTFTLSFDSNGGSEVAAVSGKYGASVPEIESPSKAGYTFAGWVFLTGSSSSVTASTPVVDLPDTFPAYNRTYKAKWTANTDTKYTVNHYKQNAEDNEYTLADTEVLTGTTGSWVTSVSTKTYEGFSNGSIYDSQRISGDGSTVVTVRYYRNTITFTLNLDGGTGTESLTGKYGAKVTPPDNPTREGYIFTGWNTEGGTLASVFEKDTTYTAVWTWSRVEGITITVENQNDITVTREDKGSALIFTAEEECDSYAWYLDDEKKGTDKTYSLDTSSLAAGTYTLALEAEKDGEWYSYFAQIKVSK